MKKLNVIAAALGWDTIERSGSAAIGDLKFEPKESVFPAVTSVAQASLRTGATPLEHGVISNGFWFEDLKKPMFWEQSATLVKGPRVWDSFRSNGGRIGLYFFQQSLGENVDVVVSPAPIHAHDGSLIMNCYAKPSDISQELNRRIGEFSLHRYWGPLASPKIGREVIDWFEGSLELWDVDEAYLYLPTLDYAAQKYGPGSRADRKAFLEFEQQILRLQKICDRKGASMSVEGDYNITAVTLPEVMPNVVLRREGFFNVRMVGRRAYPDFYSSKAFAVCDHEYCFLVGEERAKAAELLLATGDFVMAEKVSEAYPLLLAKEGSACSYKWWTSWREAPDYASHVDIHNKPGYDPKELFFFNFGRVKGTHGRRSIVASSVQV